MARVTVVSCDRCDAVIWRGDDNAAPNIPFLNFVSSASVQKRDLCPECLDILLKVVKGAEIKPPEQKQRVSWDPAEQLREVQRIANEGIEAYSDGATDEQMVQYLRDVASGARRR